MKMRKQKKTSRMSAQELTDQIAKNNGLITNLADAYANPIYQAGMAATFYRSLAHDKKRTKLRLFIGIFFLIIPALGLGSYTMMNMSKPEDMIIKIPTLIFCFVYFLVGLKIASI